MALVCPSCDQAVGTDAKPGSACAACGALLVTVSPAADPLIGAIVDGRFEVRERLGSGAMGVVYRATQKSIGRDVALKVLTTIANESAIKRFFREAKIASSLAHPNTVQIIEFGQGSDGSVYLAMELVRGHTLLDEVTEGAMPSRRIIRIGTQLCDALEAAHKLSIVHRDLKLENVMITEDDRVKVLDFGIARILGDVDTQVTAAGFAAGTPHYMAPEVLADAVDPAPAQDMYALGVILAELAIGEALWTNATSLPMLLVEKIRNTAIERVPVRLRPLVGKLMATEPEARPGPSETRKLLRDMDRATTDPVGIAATVHPPAPGSTTADAHVAEGLGEALGRLDVVNLDERDSTARDALPAGAFVPPPAPPIPKLDVVEAGAPLELEHRNDLPALDLQLEVEGGWERNRANRRPAPSLGAQRHAKENPPPAPPGGGGRWLIILLVLASVGAAGAYYVVSTRPAEKRAATQAPSPDARAPNPRRAATVDAMPVSPPDDDAPPQDPKHGVSIRIIGLPGTTIKIDGQPAGKTPISLKRSAGKRAIVIEAPGVYRRIIPDRSQTVDLSQPADRVRQGN